MKNILLLPLILLNQPTQQIIFDLDENTLTTTCTLTENERTNAANNWQEITPPIYSTREITAQQKFFTKSAVNQYADIKYTTYTNLDYKYQNGGQYYEDLATLQTFFIFQITPFFEIESTDMQLKFVCDSWLNKSTLDYYYNNGLQISTQIYRTNYDLSDYIYKTDWNNQNAVYEYMYDTIEDTSRIVKDQLYRETAVDTQMQLELSAPHTITLNDITNIEKGITTYIYGYIYYEAHFETNAYIGINTPTRQTQFVHTQQAEITFEIEPTTTTTYEVIDIGGLMFDILGMPFSFISQAFNLTLFPGTAYQVNISNILLGFIAVAFLLWVLKLILGNADIGGWLQDQKDNAKASRDQTKSYNRAVKRRANERKTLAKNNAKNNTSKKMQKRAKE